MTTKVIVYIYTPRGGSRLAHALSGTDAKKRYSIYYRDLNTTRLDAALAGASRANMRNRANALIKMCVVFPTFESLRGSGYLSSTSRRHAYEFITNK